MRGGAMAHGIVGERAAGAGVMRCGAMRGAERGGDVGAGAEARVSEAHRAQLVERGGVDCAAFGLDQGDSGGDKPEPVEIVEDRLNELAAATARVEVLNAYQEA